MCAGEAAGLLKGGIRVVVLIHTGGGGPDPNSGAQT
eukprot:CAMPEP_0174330584 /NCGR_PEP_ID=MMETSP0810-20121108/16804_1 /TAXON_ID=73025 ORGANISM="Eutreptiella gymnastica-like, Strain CCMP1594" /NCGR_SAMPLE_ID=MMETSP0810 /ASSEMBLY_ACC=CAM_ASM_000659 /LENGTH=35 /DNA_ID= /DNA_START= /DNA_END= /DNA_ORIENTATION=